MKLNCKYIIKGQIEAITGLHIGGSSTGLEIGGLDNSVIKDSMGLPYIPGSSLKGKLRSILEKAFDNNSIMKEERTGVHINGEIAQIFGAGAHKNDTHRTLTRFFSRDALLDETIAKDMIAKSGNFEELEFDYTESKMENVINRKNGTSDNLRTLERVPAGAKFNFEFIVDSYEGDNSDMLDKILTGMSLLEDDYIGGNGSRGYGQIKFFINDILEKTISDYESGGVGTSYKKWAEKNVTITKKIEKFAPVGV